MHSGGYWYCIFAFLIVSIDKFFLEQDNHDQEPNYNVFFFIITRTVFKFRVFIDIISFSKQIRPALSEIFLNLSDKDKFFVYKGKDLFKGLKKNIVFNDLSFSYIEGVPILKGINFSIEKGKVTAIVGATGADKTTLINLITRFYDCPPSSILIDGVDIRDYTLKSLMSGMALVGQEVGIFNDTLKNNIIFGLNREISDDQLVDIAKKSRLYDLVMKLPGGFHARIGNQGATLSEGEKQRIGIARAILKDSDIFILDEAYSHLDSNTAGLIQEAINEAIKEKTAIIITHRLPMIKKADKIVVVENGCLVEVGGLTELIDKRGRFFEYWEKQRF